MIYSCRASCNLYVKVVKLKFGLSVEWNWFSACPGHSIVHSTILLLIQCVDSKYCLITLLIPKLATQFVLHRGGGGRRINLLIPLTRHICRPLEELWVCLELIVGIRWILGADDKMKVVRWRFCIVLKGVHSGTTRGPRMITASLC